MSTDINTRVSLSLHPQTVTKIDGFSEETRGYIAGTERALHEAYSGISSVHAAMDAAKKDPTLNDAARVIKVDDLAQRTFQRLAKLFDAESTRLDKGIALQEEKLSAPVQAKASHYLAAEVRAFVREMPDNDRAFFIRSAIRKGDDITATACLGGPAYLSGLNDEMHGVLLKTYHEHNAPDEAAKLKVMLGARALIAERGGLLHSQLENAVGRPPHEVRLLREAKDRSDKAFAV
ncbi:MAG: hypothetical protein CL808_04885 [Citromicrobium sp.]|nr:hypothetical protein [Citromicrobium sp.]